MGKGDFKCTSLGLLTSLCIFQYQNIKNKPKSADLDTFDISSTT